MIALCVDCELKANQSRVIDYNLRASAENASRARVRESLGLPPARGRQLIPMQIFGSGDLMTFHNITIHGSNYGVVNTGQFRTVDLAITSLRSEGQDRVADALLRMTQAVDDLVKSNQIATHDRDGILAMLTAISEEASKPAERRSSVVGMTLVTELAKMVAAFVTLSREWAVAIPLLAVRFQS